MSFPETEWYDRGIYWESRAEQRSPTWHKHRSGRITASNIGTAAGYNHFTTCEQLAMELSGLVDKHVTTEQRQRMDFGTNMEPVARQWYSNKYNIPVHEAGLCVPKWNLRLGASPDGLIGEDGILEIKCPQSFPFIITAYMERVNSGWKPPEGYHEHIYNVYFCQIQSTLKILDRKWCDYVVFCQPQNKVFTQRVYRDEKFWEEELYPKVQTFIERLDACVAKGKE